jgi:hypothetical protein
MVPLAKGTDGTARPFPMARFDAATRGRTASGTLNLGFLFVDIRKPRGFEGPR